MFCIPAYAGSTGETSERRIAIVIVNGLYADVKSSMVPVAKGVQLSAVLRGLNFEVIEAYNLSQTEFTTALLQFGLKLKGYDVSLLYYTGLALQFDGMNHLLSSDAQSTSIFDLNSHSVELDKIIDVQQRNGSLNVVYLDAATDAKINDKISKNLVALNYSKLNPGIASVSIPLTNTIFMSSSSTNTEWNLNGKRRAAFIDALIKYLPTKDIEVSQLSK